MAAERSSAACIGDAGDGGGDAREKERVERW